MFKIAMVVSAASIAVLAASTAYATPKAALGGTDTRTSAGGHMSHGMHHMKMKHSMKTHKAM